MEMAKHTGGRLRYTAGHCQYLIGTEGRLALAKPMPRGEPLAGGRPITLEEAEANARHLVACWNACEEAGIPTEALEDGAVWNLRHVLEQAPKPGAADVLAWLHEYSRWYHEDRAKALAAVKG